MCRLIAPPLDGQVGGHLPTISIMFVKIFLKKFIENALEHSMHALHHLLPVMFYIDDSEVELYHEQEQGSQVNGHRL